MKVLLLMVAVSLAVGTLLASCSQSPSTIEAVEGTWIRVQNDSAVDYDQVIVGFPGQREDYGPVAAGTESEYRKIPIAYRYASVEVYVSEVKHDLQVFDYVGETPLDNGRFTYAISMEENHIVLTFVER